MSLLARVPRSLSLLQRYTIVGVVVVSGVTASLRLWYVLFGIQTANLNAEVLKRASDRGRLLDSSLQRSMDVLHSIGSFYSTRGGAEPDVGVGVTRDEFRSFVADALARQPELRALGWTPIVAASDRNRFEDAARRDGLVDFEFREHDPAGLPVRARVRDQYLPVLYLEPQETNGLALGFELDSDPTRAAALELAAATGQAAATAPISLVQEKGQSAGFIVYLPVFRTRSDDRRHLLGYASAVYRVADLVNAVAAELHQEGLGVAIDDASAGIRLYDLPTGTSQGSGSQHVPISIAGRTWTVSVTPSPAFILSHRDHSPLLILIGGSLITSLLTVYLCAGLRQRTLIERRVTERTVQLREEVGERRRAEQMALDAESRYRGIFDNAVEGIFQTSIDGKYIHANPALARIYGYDSIASLIADLTNIDDRLYVERGRRSEFVRRIHEQGVVWEFESEVFRRDGLRIWISENARVVRDGSGEVAYYEGTVVDITARKHADELLRAERDRLETGVAQRTAELNSAVVALQVEVADRRRAEEAAASANQAKSLFLASISHEIRTPMNGILGYAQLLAADASLTPAQHDAVQTIRGSGRHLLDLIDDVLDLSKIEAGHADLSLAPFSLTDAVREVVALFAARCKEAGLTLDLHARPFGERWPQAVLGDSRKLRQVLINLIGNAIKFTDCGGVSVTVASVGPDEYRFCVKDSGVGIAPSELATILEPFRQTADGNARGGTGLGLAIAGGQLQLMQSALQVESKVGVGSSFSFTLSLPEAEAEPPPSFRLAVPAGRSIHVLVVDDVAVSRQVVADLVGLVGCQASSASSAAEALEQLDVALRTGRTFDAVLIDVHMPVVDGLKAASSIAARGESPPLIAMSASAFAHEQSRCLESGFSAFLAKPIDLQRLASTLSRLLGIELIKPTISGPSKPVLKKSVEVDVVRTLRRRVITAARRCGVMDLRLCLAEAEQAAPGMPAIVALRQGLKSYDMDLIIRAFDETADTEVREQERTLA